MLRGGGGGVQFCTDGVDDDPYKNCSVRLPMDVSLTWPGSNRPRAFHSACWAFRARLSEPFWRTGELGVLFSWWPSNWASRNCPVSWVPSTTRCLTRDGRGIPGRFSLPSLQLQENGEPRDAKTPISSVRLKQPARRSARASATAGGEECPLPLPRQAVGAQDPAV
jgi:hypothetical protein